MAGNCTPVGANCVNALVGPATFNLGHIMPAVRTGVMCKYEFLDDQIITSQIKIMHPGRVSNKGANDNKYSQNFSSMLATKSARRKALNATKIKNTCRTPPISLIYLPVFVHTARRRRLGDWQTLARHPQMWLIGSCNPLVPGIFHLYRLACRMTIGHCVNLEI